MCHVSTDLRKLVPVSFLRHDMGFIRDHGDEATKRLGDTDWRQEEPPEQDEA